MINGDKLTAVVTPLAAGENNWLVPLVAVGIGIWLAYDT